MHSEIALLWNYSIGSVFSQSGLIWSSFSELWDLDIMLWAWKNERVMVGPWNVVVPCGWPEWSLLDVWIEGMEKNAVALQPLRLNLLTLQLGLRQTLSSQSYWYWAQICRDWLMLSALWLLRFMILLMYPTIMFPLLTVVPLCWVIVILSTLIPDPLPPH